MLAADRAVANTHEQMGPFLAGLWLHACFVSPDGAAALGALYVALRALYPLLLGPRIEAMQSRRVAFVTLPCYAIIAGMLVHLVLEAWIL